MTYWTGTSRGLVAVMSESTCDTGPALFACGQFDILGSECPSCGGSVNWLTPGGLRAANGLFVCSEECVEAESARREKISAQRHLDNRDLLCDCPEVCAPAGLPTQEMRDQEAAWIRRGRQPWEPADFDRRVRESDWT
jgi:hypothetical protein